MHHKYVSTCFLILTFSAILSGCATLTQAAAPSSGSGPVGATVTIGPDGSANPKNITIKAGEVVTFVNKDTRPHTMFSTPHPGHSDCPDLNAVGELKPGEMRNTGNFKQARICGFHDHMNSDNDALRGSITVQ